MKYLKIFLHDVYMCHISVNITQHCLCESVIIGIFQTLTTMEIHLHLVLMLHSV